jgi:hypothetical protein
MLAGEAHVADHGWVDEDSTMNTTAPAPSDAGKPPPPGPAPADVVDESVAGEEDPGASLDVALGTPAPPAPPPVPRRKD